MLVLALRRPSLPPPPSIVPPQPVNGIALPKTIGEVVNAMVMVPPLIIKPPLPVTIPFETIVLDPPLPETVPRENTAPKITIDLIDRRPTRAKKTATETKTPTEMKTKPVPKTISARPRTAARKL